MTMSSRRAVVALAIAGVGICTAALPASAVAPSLPATDSIYVVGSSPSPVSLYALTTPDSAPAASAAASVDGVGYVLSADYDEASGTAYLFGRPGDDYWRCSFVAVDVATGTSAAPVAVNVNGDEAYACPGADISDGVIRLAIGDGNIGSNVEFLGTLDPVTGDITDSVSFTGDIVTDDYWFEWIATDPTSGIMYGGTVDNVIYTIDVETGATVRVRTDLLPDGFTAYAADFDSAGTLWLTGWPDGGGNHLFSASSSDDFATVTDHGEIADPDAYNGIFVVTKPAQPEPTLATTGSAASAVAPVAMAALVAGGAAVAFGVLRRRRANA